jgi:hypothetical protein
MVLVILRHRKVMSPAEYPRSVDLAQRRPVHAAQAVHDRDDAIAAARHAALALLMETDRGHDGILLVLFLVFPWMQLPSDLNERSDIRPPTQSHLWRKALGGRIPLDDVVRQRDASASSRHFPRLQVLLVTALTNASLHY